MRTEARYVLQLMSEVHRLRELVMLLSQNSCHACSLSAGGICHSHVEVLHIRRQAMKETVRHE